MSQIVQKEYKGMLINFYERLSEEEKNIQKGDRVNEANSDPSKEFTFLYWEINPDRSRYAKCRDGDMNRYFFPDAIKKSYKQIKHEEKRSKNIGKKVRKRSSIRTGLGE